MTTIHHINCGSIQPAAGPRASCHCLVLEGEDGLALVDAGIGLLDCRNADERIGRALIDMVGFQFDEDDTAARRIEALGFRAADVKHIVLTHCDPDHAGGLADFPAATIHVAEEELASLRQGNARYLPVQFIHGPNWKSYGASSEDWFGLQARRVDLGSESRVLLVPLFGHTLGHCGVAIEQGDRWVLHVGDAYYLRVELDTDDHPVSQLAAQRADEDGLRRQSLQQLRRLAREHPDEIAMFGYHDFGEFPKSVKR